MPQFLSPPRIHQKLLFFALFYSKNEKFEPKKSNLGLLLKKLTIGTCFRSLLSHYRPFKTYLGKTYLIPPGT